MKNLHQLTSLKVSELSSVNCPCPRNDRQGADYDDAGRRPNPVYWFFTFR